jgi:hypothetical protein
MVLQHSLDLNHDQTGEGGLNSRLSLSLQFLVAKLIRSIPSRGTLWLVVPLLFSCSPVDLTFQCAENGSGTTTFASAR